MASDSLCLENIDEFVHDENKIVTCKWLSLTLKIHVNQAKRLLYTFLQQQRKKDKDVNATYFVAGLFKGDNGHMEHKCVVVGEEDLEVTRRQLTTVTSCHVYSIQRTNLKDSNSLYTTDYDGVRENLADCNKYSSIHCQRAEVPRRQPSRKTASPDKAASAQSSEDKGSSKAGGQQTNGAGSHKAADAVEQRGSKGKKAEPKGSIATMFAQSNKSKDGGNKKTETAPKEAVKESKPAAKKGGVMDFFANAKPAAKPKAAAAAAAVAVAAEEETAVSKKGKAAEKKGKAATEPKRKKSRPAEDSDSDNQPDKKRRRRIKNDLFDSSSEEEIEIEAESPAPSPEREDPPSEPESPPPSQRTPEKRAREPSPPQGDTPANGTKQRRRRRKQVPKTYLDEDGFMVTEKVWESESTDASEVEEEAKKKATATAAKTSPKKAQPSPAKKASPQKKTSPAKGKQTSLMSFFKKK